MSSGPGLLVEQAILDGPAVSSRLSQSSNPHLEHAREHGEWIAEARESSSARCASSSHRYTSIASGSPASTSAYSRIATMSTVSGTEFRIPRT